MKIITDISNDVYTRLFDNGIQDNEIAVDDVFEMARALRNGTPLDNNSDRAEVQAYFDGALFGWDEGRKALIDEIKKEIRKFGDNAYIHVPYVLNILANIDKAESEMKLNFLTRKSIFQPQKLSELKPNQTTN